MLVRRGMGLTVAQQQASAEQSGFTSMLTDKPQNPECTSQFWTVLCRMANGGICPNCDYTGLPAPSAPVIPSGSLDVNQNPAGPAGGGVYSIDQVIADTAAAQRAQVQDYFSGVADQTQQSDWSWLLIAGVAVGLFLAARGLR